MTGSSCSHYFSICRCVWMCLRWLATRLRGWDGNSNWGPENFSNLFCSSVEPFSSAGNKSFFFFFPMASLQMDSPQKTGGTELQRCYIGQLHVHQNIITSLSHHTLQATWEVNSELSIMKIVEIIATGSNKRKVCLFFLPANFVVLVSLMCFYNCCCSHANKSF